MQDIISCQLPGRDATHSRLYHFLYDNRDNLLHGLSRMATDDTKNFINTRTFTDDTENYYMISN